MVISAPNLLEEITKGVNVLSTTNKTLCFFASFAISGILAISNKGLLSASQ